MLKGVAIALAVIHYKSDDVRICVWNLDGVRLDVRHGEAPFLHLVLQVYHEQRSAFGYDVVTITRIAEGVLESCASQAVYRIDGCL